MSGLKDISKLFSEIFNTNSLLKTLEAVGYHMMSHGVSFVESKNTVGLVDIDNTHLVTIKDRLFEKGWVVKHRENIVSGSCDISMVEATFIDGDVVRGYMTIRYDSVGRDSVVRSVVGDELSDVVQLVVGELSKYKTPEPVVIKTLLGYSSNSGMPRLKARYVEHSDNPPIDEFYPFIKGGISELSDGYLKSNNNLLLLMGIPGSGKTTLMRELCRHYSDQPIIQITGAKLIEDENFNGFISDLSDGSIIIIEDADALLLSRRSGNQSMAMLLNELDGIASRDIKFIMSTNLSNVSDIDEAIYRTGRCYDVINFRKLTLEEIAVIGDVYGVDVSHIDGKSILADIFNKNPIKESDVKNSVGFLRN